MQVLDSINRYSKRVNDNCHPTQYYDWTPGSRYLFQPNKEALELVADRLAGPTIKRELGQRIFILLSQQPSLCSLFPLFSKQQISVPSSNKFQLAIIGSQIKLFNFSNNTVTTLNKTNESLESEIKFREELPERINVPEILSYDDQFSHYTEKMIRGDEPNDPINDWEYIKEALLQLMPLYEQSREWKEINNIIHGIKRNFQELEICDNKYIKESLSILEELSLPDGLFYGTVHGDFHVGNILVSDKVYILDWENRPKKPLIVDFFKLFSFHYDITGDLKPFYGLIDGTGQSGAIINEFSNMMGDQLFKSRHPHSGLALLYLLYDISIRETRMEAIRSTKYEILTNITKKFG